MLDNVSVGTDMLKPPNTSTQEEDTQTERDAKMFVTFDVFLVLFCVSWWCCVCIPFCMFLSQRCKMNQKINRTIVET